jgi:hypothetical protein
MHRALSSTKYKKSDFLLLLVLAVFITLYILNVLNILFILPRKVLLACVILTTLATVTRIFTFTKNMKPKAHLNDKEVDDIIREFENRTNESFRFKGNTLMISYTDGEGRKTESYDLLKVVGLKYEKSILWFYETEKDKLEAYNQDSGLGIEHGIPDYYEPSMREKMPVKVWEKIKNHID